MRTRKKQRENHKLKKEEMLDKRDIAGVLDTTPYYAVLQMRHGIFYAQKEVRQHG